MDQKPASIWQRGKAAIADDIVSSVIIGVPWLLISAYIVGTNEEQQPLILVFAIIAYIGIFSYKIITTIRFNGATLGKLVTRQRVIPLSGEKLKLYQILVRYFILDLYAIVIIYLSDTSDQNQLLLAIAMLLLFFLPILFDPKHRGFHDFIAGTRVVSTD